MKHKQTTYRAYNTITRYDHRRLVGADSKLSSWCFAHVRITGIVLGLLITAGFLLAGLVEAL